MKILTVKQPWAFAIMTGVKRVENRVWSTKYRGEFLIHASRQEEPWIVAETVLQRVAQHLNLRSSMVFDLYGRRRYMGHIVATANLVDCVTDCDDPWFCGPYGFIMDAIVPVDPVPWRGSLGLRDTPPELSARIRLEPPFVNQIRSGL